MRKLGRRTLLKATAAVAASSLLPRFSIGRPGPAANSRVNVALIGAGGRGAALLKELAAENVVALCDVDEVRAAESFAAHPDVPRFEDFRDMLDKKGNEIDAVCIATPDHTHFVATYAAMALGKHVFTEKPLTHNIWQARTLRKAARHYKVITQMGNQGHAQEGIRIVREWVEAGAIGEVREVVAYNGGPTFGPRQHFNLPSRYPPTSQAVPETLNWNLWKGPVADDIKYNEVYLPLTWRGFYAFGNGQLGDWACHTLDAAFWALQLEVPTSVEVTEREQIVPDMVPATSVVRYTCPRRGKRPVTITWYEGILPKADPAWGMGEWRRGVNSVIVGEKGCITTGGYSQSPRLYPESRWEALRSSLSERKYARIRGTHVDEWFSAVKGDGSAPGSNFEYASRLTELALLGAIAQRTGERISWDAERMRITNLPELNRYIKEPVRRGWEAGEELWR